MISKKVRNAVLSSIMAASMLLGVLCPCLLYTSYIGTQFWNQGRTQEIKDRVLHMSNETFAQEA